MPLALAIVYFVLVPISAVIVLFAAVEMYLGHKSEKESERRLRDFQSLLEPKYRDLVR